MKLSLRIFIVFLIGLPMLGLAQADPTALAEAELKEGEKLFLGNCASCHAKDMKTKMTGPALGGVLQRWEGRDELLYAWIKNSQAVIATGDEYAVNLYNEYNKSVMQAFPNLSDEDITKVLGFIYAKYNELPPYEPKEDVAAVGTTGAVAEETDNTFLYIGLFAVLALLALILARIITNLNQIAVVQEGGAPPPRKTLAEILTSRSVVAFVVFALVVLGGYTTVNNAISLNRQQGYQPEQPIKFSHATHSGIQQIDCQYCHDGARRSKHSVIPATNTCMNCHSAIKVGSKYGTQELTKVFASAGYNPNTNLYQDLSQISEDSIAMIYKQWIGEQYLSAEGLDVLGAEGEKFVEDQWEHIVASLTTEVKEEVYGPIPWVRIHNLPDHAYFNHAQHVSVGKVECQTCHGPMEEMEVAQQYSPLSMGWCINCHRKTEVDFNGNDYYQSYEQYHEEIKAGDREKVTVEDIGGLECQKCHY